MRIWVLGAEGLLGKALSGFPNCIGTSKAQVDITDLEALKRYADKIEPTHIVNCAAYTDVEGAEANADLAYLINRVGPKNLGTLGCKVIHISTDYVFDGISDRPYREEDRCNPLSVYAKSKFQGEQELLSVAPEACIVRTSWLFGTGGKNFISNLLPLMQKEKEIKVDGSQRSKATHCSDLCEAIVSLLDTSGIFHFANEEECSRYEVACYMQQVAMERGISLVCESIIPFSFSGKAMRPAYSVLNTEKIRSILKKKIRSWKDVILEERSGTGTRERDV